MRLDLRGQILGHYCRKACSLSFLYVVVGDLVEGALELVSYLEYLAKPTTKRGLYDKFLAWVILKSLISLFMAFDVALFIFHSTLAFGYHSLEVVHSLTTHLTRILLLYIG